MHTSSFFLSLYTVYSRGQNTFAAPLCFLGLRLTSSDRLLPSGPAADSRQASVPKMAASRRRPYGDIMNIDTTGASADTANQDRLGFDGPAASHQLVKTDDCRLKSYKDRIMDAAATTGVDPAIVAAIVSRESRAGNVLDNGWGDNGNAFGLMQIDKRYHTPLEGAYDSVEHLVQGSKILIDMFNTIQVKFPTWTAEQQLKGAISAYNAGPRNVRSYDKMDVGTTGNDYANDVVARAQWLRRNLRF
uniref:Lysozyme g n=2 Tax=Petromyzon marinus TaxID=7757 RepID=A0AAJ7WME0_PETMA|nr:lysozyme g-like isoform X1 [Petromyzon marinus]